MASIPNDSSKAPALVVKNLAYSYLFGTDFLEKHGAIFNYSDNLIIVSNNDFEMDTEAEMILWQPNCGQDRIFTLHPSIKPGNHTKTDVDNIKLI